MQALNQEFCYLDRETRISLPLFPNLPASPGSWQVAGPQQIDGAMPAAANPLLLFLFPPVQACGVSTIEISCFANPFIP